MLLAEQTEKAVILMVHLLFLEIANHQDLKNIKISISLAYIVQIQYPEIKVIVSKKD